MLNICSFSSLFNHEAKQKPSAPSHLGGSSLAKSALGAAVMVMGLAAGPAHALVVNVAGQNWDVTTFSGSYDENTSKFNTAANGGVMPWWGSDPLAKQFAIAVGGQFGYPNGCVDGACYGPAFATLAVDKGPYRALDGFSHFVSCNLVCEIGLLNFRESQDYRAASVAQATLIPIAVPGPLPIFGTAAAFSASRQLRKRIKSHQSRSSATTPMC